MLDVSGSLRNSITLVLYRKTSTVFVRLARIHIISTEVDTPYGRINQTLRSQDELGIGFLPVLFPRLRSLADICWRRDEGRREKIGEKEILNALRQELSCLLQQILAL